MSSIFARRVRAGVIAMAMTATTATVTAFAACPLPDDRIPLHEFPPSDTYLGEPGGLFPNGLNTPPEAHRALGLRLASQIAPLGVGGLKLGDPGYNPDDAWIVLLTVGFSNTTHESAVFERDQDINLQRNARVVVLNGAQGTQSAAKIKDSNAEYWGLVSSRLAANALTHEQVQAVWLKETNYSSPRQGCFGDATGFAATLRDDLREVVTLLKQKFINLKIVYLSSRISAEYMPVNSSNPEPDAYESGFSVKWLIADQINGNGLNTDDTVGAVVAPWLTWGPYLWANSSWARSDGLVWNLDDFERDFTHPSAQGEKKVADQLGSFLASEETAISWYLSKSDTTLTWRDAVNDAYVKASTPDSNNGTSSDLRVGDNDTNRFYLRFDLRGIDRNRILRAKLSLRGRTSSPPVEIYTIQEGARWNEATITWNNAPAPTGSVIQTTGQISANGTVSADVTSFVKSDADGLVTLVGKTTGATGIFASRDTDPVTGQVGEPPRLVLTLKK